MLAPMTFRFLNETRSVAAERSDTNAASQLWRYNLHYFDDLNARDVDARRAWHIAAMEAWVPGNPPGNCDAWAPYPVSLRIVNWIKWTQCGNALSPTCLHSLAVQVRWLVPRVEAHLLGNHLFVNAKALVFAGLFFDGEESRRWLEKGMRILAREIPEQILEDGGQYERSPMYHALAFEDLLDLLNVARTFSAAVPDQWQPFIASWPAIAGRMRAWLSAMSHPDGEISFFNDAAFAIAPSPSELGRYADDLRIAPPRSDGDEVDDLRVLQLPESGYLRVEAQAAVVLIDAAPLGPDYLLAHAHADTLSFELSLFGHRVIVNSGTSRYGQGPERDAERGTPAHSTVTVDGKDSSEVWSAFRVARRARPVDLDVSENKQCVRVSCGHDGYRRLPGKPTHRRTWTIEARSMSVEDRVEGRGCAAIARYHLHPEVDCTLDEPGAGGWITVPGGRRVRFGMSGVSSLWIEAGFYCPEFGRRDPTRCIAAAFATDSSVMMELSW
jgi:uncharacterized heparinase superfamily protein